jgi:site-specific recombinase XerD
MTTEAITPLRQRMIEDMNARKLCAGTQRGHILSCKRFAAFLKRSPDAATIEDIRRFQLHLAETGVSIYTRNRTMTGLRFLLRVTLRRLDLAEEVYHIREPEKLPLVMSADEIKQLLALHCRHAGALPRTAAVGQNRNSSSTDAMAPGRDLDLQDSCTILQKGAQRCGSVCRIGYPRAAAG